MKKRIKQKLGNRYNLLRRAKRQKLKRKGKQCIDYAHVLMGEKDFISFNKEGYSADYPYATHLLIEIVPCHYSYNAPYIIYTYPVNSTGRSNKNLILSIVDSGKLEDILPTYQETVEDIKNDRYMASLFA